jgi:putative peptidoglycan lipid II flippase
MGDAPTTADLPTIVIPRVGGQPAPTARVPADAGTRSVAQNSAVMAVFSLVSRITGFLRTAALAAVIGGAAVANDYNLANTFPNMVYELLLGGVLASVVVPLLVRARSRDADGGQAYTHRLLTLATVLLAGATVIAVAAAPLLARLFANDRTTTADQHLITVLGYLLLPEIFFYGLAALLAAVLNTRGHFAAPTWTPILNNVVVIVTAVVFTVLPTVDGLDATTISTAQILTLGIGTTFGIVVQAFGLWPALRKVGFRWRWRFDFGALGLGELGRVGGWMLVYVAVSQLGVVGVLNIAQRAFDRGGAGPAIYLNAFLIFMMAHGVVAVSIITALMPRMSQAAAEHRHADVAAQLALGTRLSAVILVPATALYLVLGKPLAIVLFERGLYTHREAIDTGNVIAFAGLALLPFAISQLQIFAFYAMPDTRTPALVNIPSVIVRLGVDILILVTLSASSVAAGLMLGNAISFVLASVLGYWLLRRRIGPLGMAAVARSLLRLAVAAAIAAGPAWLVSTAVGRVMGNDWTGALVQLAAGALVLGLGYLVVALLLRAREVTEVLSMVRGRLGR